MQLDPKNGRRGAFDLERKKEEGGSGKCSQSSQAWRGNWAEVGLNFLMSLNCRIIKVRKELQDD